MAVDLTAWKRSRVKNDENRTEITSFPTPSTMNPGNECDNSYPEQYSTQAQPPTSFFTETGEEFVRDTNLVHRKGSTCNAIQGNFKRILSRINWEVDVLYKFATIPIYCGLCDQLFSHGDIILSEIAKRDIQIHRDSGKRAKCGFICVACGANLSQESCLSQHIYVHILQKDFICLECQSKANQQFLCERKCGDLSRYFSSASMPNMALLHPEQCMVCNSLLPRPDLLIFSMMQKRSIDGGFIYTCNVCQKQYLDFRNMQHHVLDHINKKEILCMSCMEDILSTT